MPKVKDYPWFAYSCKREWLQVVRNRWFKFSKIVNNDVYTGSAFYPPEVYEWLDKVREEKKKMDIIMKDYYKNA